MANITHHRSFSTTPDIDGDFYTNGRLEEAALTKTNEGERRGGGGRWEVVRGVRWTSLSISKLHFQTGGPAAEPVGPWHPHTIYLRAWGTCGGGQLMAVAPAFDEFVCDTSAPSGGVLKQTSTYQTFLSSTSQLEENEAKNKTEQQPKKKKKTANSPTTVSEAWK